MKKTVWMLPLAALVMTGCSKADDNFTSPDLAYADLHGHVKSVEIASTPAVMEGDKMVPEKAEEGPNETVTKYIFDDNGRLTEYSESYTMAGEMNPILSYTVDYSSNEKGTPVNTTADEWMKKYNVLLDRDAQGYISAFSVGVNQDFDGQRDIKYTWTDGRKTQEDFTGWEDGSTSTFEYNEAGELMKETIHSTYIGGESDLEITYRITDRDKNGNWTRREKTHIITRTVDEFEGEETDPQQPWYIIESRKIEYTE